MPIVRLDQAQQFAAINVLSDPGHIGGPVVIPFLTQVLISWGLPGGKTGHNVLYGRSVGTPQPSVSQAQAIFSGLTTGAQWTALATHMVSSTQLLSVTLTSVHTAGLPSFVSTGSAVSGSDAASQALPSEVALVVTLRTGGRGPSNRGRMYITGFSATQLAAGNVALASLVTDLAAWANNIKSVLSSQGLTWVIANPERAAYVGSTGTDHPARPAGSVDVVSAIVRDNHWDSQRRRGLR